MKIKKVEIRIKSIKDVFNDVKETVKKIERGEKLMLGEKGTVLFS